jgi:hypothetical protein
MIFLSLNSCASLCNTQRTLYIPPSDINYAPYNLITSYTLNRLDTELYGTDIFSTCDLTIAYNRTFKSSALAYFLFGTQTLRFAGSKIADRAPNELLADNFGLAQDFEGIIKLNPFIYTTIVNIDVELQFYTSRYRPFIKIYVPFVHTTWDLQAKEFSLAQALALPLEPFEPGIMSCQHMVVPAQSIEQALSGTFTFGDLQEPLPYSRLSFKRCTLSKLSDIFMFFGGNVIKTDKGYLAMYCQLVIPTGNKPSPAQIFAPIIGNGNHIQVGIGYAAQTILIRARKNTLTVSCEGIIAHRLSTCQLRTFDLCSQGPLSRYMLLKEFTNNDTQYAQSLIHTTAITTKPVLVAVPLVGSFALHISHAHRTTILDIGYIAYGQSSEKLSPLLPALSMRPQRVGIKGTERVSGFDTGLNTTQQKATPYRPASADITPVLITSKDFDLQSASMPSTVIHQFYGTISHQYTTDYTTTYFTVGLSLAVSSTSTDNLPYNQWGTWLQATVAF